MLLIEQRNVRIVWDGEPQKCYCSIADRIAVPPEEMDDTKIGIDRMTEYYYRKGYSENRTN